MYTWLVGQRRHPFWEKQPVAHTPVDLLAVKPVDIGKPLDVQHAASCALPNKALHARTSELAINGEPPVIEGPISGLYWCRLHVENSAELADMVGLLGDHYVEDSPSTLRFAYSADFLRWALEDYVFEMPTTDACGGGAEKDDSSTPSISRLCSHPALIVGIRDSQMTLKGCIAATLMPMHIGKSTAKIALVNFLCVHRELRGHQLAPLLIKELTRLVHAEYGVFQALFSTERILPAPVATCRYVWLLFSLCCFYC